MRALQWTLVAALLAVCAGFPIIQAVHETVGEGRPHLANLFDRAPTKESLHRWDENAKDRSIFAKWLRPRTLQLRYDLLGEMNPKALEGRDGWLFYNQDVDYLLQPPYTDERFYSGTFDSLIGGQRVNLRNPLVAMQDFKDRLEARGIELLVVPIPGKPSIYPEKLAAGIAGQPASPTLALLEDMRRRGFRVVDLFAPLLAAKARGGAELYLKRDTHWTPEGVEVAADAIAQALAALGLPPAAPGGPGGRYAAGEAGVDRWGDIAEMTKVPERRSKVPERRSIWPTEKVKARPVSDLATGKPYADDPKSPILWLGDSFSRIYQTDEPRAAGIIAQVALRLGRPLASVVNDGGASTVVRQQLARKGRLLRDKRVVVWTFVERDLRFGSKGWLIEDLPEPVPDEQVTKTEAP
jgi:hypothetical protein